MGYEGGELTNNHKERLKLLEKLLSYPPRFRLKFKLQLQNIMEVKSQSVTVRFNGVNPPTTIDIVLEKAGIYIPSFILL